MVAHGTTPDAVIANKNKTERFSLNNASMRESRLLK